MHACIESPQKLASTLQFPTFTPKSQAQWQVCRARPPLSATHISFPHPQSLARHANLRCLPLSTAALQASRHSSQMRGHPVALSESQVASQCYHPTDTLDGTEQPNNWKRTVGGHSRSATNCQTLGSHSATIAYTLTDGACGSSRTQGGASSSTTTALSGCWATTCRANESKPRRQQLPCWQ
jgi:hypothetical protein